MRSMNENPPAQRYFLIVSNMRSGSTLLQFMLGELADVATDYEMKYKPAFPTQPIHLVVDKDDADLKAVIARAVPSASIIGTKLVMDPIPIASEKGYAPFFRLVQRDVHIIHIKRPYWQILISASRGIVHLPALEKDAKGSKAYAILQERKDPQYALTQSRGSDEYLPDFRECMKQFLLYLKNDLAALSLCTHHPHYLVRYAAIRTQFQRICRFLGTRDSAEHIQAIIAQPPFQKLPPILLQRRNYHLRCIGWCFDVLFWLSYVITIALRPFRRYV